MLAIAGLTAGPYCNHGTRYPGYPVPWVPWGVTLAKKIDFLNSTATQNALQLVFYTKTYFTGFH